ncbi:hypothetical protein [Parvibaculum sp.]|uniref:hypothetical protein n=1 Tax=Parvibaculum sp. TaxID=2024848 RepID=UPI0027306B99|nr:hypothetical protein [Parvibaculum sp.]MDP1627368.1 hypothetical protein [Parvibaculum sp.]MDP2149447.1 hypothetical protein [Parvibaculum sp.]MDP3328098.1 hypothetical protein [Parvibaculum sp.]
MSNFMKTAIAIIVLAVVLVIGYRVMNPDDTTIGDAIDATSDAASDAMDATGEAASDAMDTTEEAVEEAVDDMSGEEAPAPMDAEPAPMEEPAPAE